MNIEHTEKSLGCIRNGIIQMSESEETPYDEMLIRCPKLGGEVTFAYCRKEAGKIPCSRTIVCWQLRFPVHSVLRSLMSDEEWNLSFSQEPKPKVISLVELIERAKEDLKKNET